MNEIQCMMYINFDFWTIMRWFSIISLWVIVAIAEDNETTSFIDTTAEFLPEVSIAESTTSLASSSSVKFLSTLQEQSSRSTSLLPIFTTSVTKLSTSSTSMTMSASSSFTLSKDSIAMPTSSNSTFVQLNVSMKTSSNESSKPQINFALVYSLVPLSMLFGFVLLYCIKPPSALDHQYRLIKVK